MNITGGGGAGGATGGATTGGAGGVETRRIVKRWRAALWAEVISLAP